MEPNNTVEDHSRSNRSLIVRYSINFLVAGVSFVLSFITSPISLKYGFLNDRIAIWYGIRLRIISGSTPTPSPRSTIDIMA